MASQKYFRKNKFFLLSCCGAIALTVALVAFLIGFRGKIEADSRTDKVIDFGNLEPASGTLDLPPIPGASDTDQKNNGKSAEKEELPLRISPDKPEVVKLDRDAVNVLVGSDETLRAVPDTNRTIVLIPKKPGATYFKAIDAEGKVIMQRHVIVGSIEKGNQYIRIRRACANDDTNCKQFSVYYCPDMCHEVNVVQGNGGADGTNNRTPDIAPSNAEPDDSATEEYVEPATPNPPSSAHSSSH